MTFWVVKIKSPTPCIGEGGWIKAEQMIQATVIYDNIQFILVLNLVSLLTFTQSVDDLFHLFLSLCENECILIYNPHLCENECILIYNPHLCENECILIYNPHLCENECILIYNPHLCENECILIYNPHLCENECILIYNPHLCENECVLVSNPHSNWHYTALCFLKFSINCVSAQEWNANIECLGHICLNTVGHLQGHKTEIKTKRRMSDDITLCLRSTKKQCDGNNLRSGFGTYSKSRAVFFINSEKVACLPALICLVTVWMCCFVCDEHW